jgi:hypothetical protein
MQVPFSSARGRMRATPFFTDAPLIVASSWEFYLPIEWHSAVPAALTPTANAWLQHLNAAW